MVDRSDGLSLRDVLRLEIVQRADPELVHGEHLLHRAVRWVHTSELAQVPSLLKGGELLLTSGLGLAHHGRAAHSGYVHELADKQLAALALELGWYFDEVPDALLVAARERDLPLIALRRVVPFVEITEEIQARIVHRQAARFRLDSDVQALLNQVLLREEGMAGVVTQLSQLLGAPVVVRTAGGQTAAIAGAEGRPEAARGVISALASAPIRLLDEDWGTLEVGSVPDGSTPAPAILGAVLAHGPTAVALTLLRDRDAVPLRRRLSAELVGDLLAGRSRPRRDLETRATLAGFDASMPRRMIGFALGDYRPEDAGLALVAAEAAASRLEGGLVAAVNDDVFGVISSGALQQSQELAEAFFHRLKELMFARGASRSPLLVLGPAVKDLEALGRSLRDAASTLELARQIQPRHRAVTTRGMAADRLLSRLADQPDELAAFVDGELGPLIAHDERNGSQLVPTLWAYLTFGQSKSELSRMLHLRRQSLYQRLDKIEQLLGGGLDDPERRVSIILALKAHDVLRRRAL